LDCLARVPSRHAAGRYPERLQYLAAGPSPAPLARVLRFSGVEGENDMKKILTTALFLGVLAAFKAQPAAAQISVNISIGGFYDQLSPYGEWVDCSYGDCWVPGQVDASWQPYSNGEWIYTEYGWTWVSYDPWGEDPYHYGTWTYIDRYGWAWVPGTVWAPAWVTWSYSDNYVGWAPLPPNYAFGYSGYSGRPIVLSANRYVFVPTNRFIGSNVRTSRIAPQQTATIFRQTTPITRFGVTGGIVRNTALPIDRIQRATRSRIETRSIRTARPISGWTRDSRRQVSIIAPAQEVRRAISSRPQRGSRATGNEGGRMNRPTDTRQQPQAVPQAQPGTVYRDRNRRAPQQAQPQAAPPVERREIQRQPAPVQAQPNSNAPAYRERGRGRPEARQQAAPPQAQPQPQVAPPQAQPHPRRLEKPGRGPGQENRGKPSKEQREGPGKGKAKGKDKDKDKPE
jgi:hypothetical protein